MKLGPQSVQTITTQIKQAAELLPSGHPVKTEAMELAANYERQVAGGRTDFSSSEFDATHGRLIQVMFQVLEEKPVVRNMFSHTDSRSFHWAPPSTDRSGMTDADALLFAKLVTEVKTDGIE